MIAAECNGARAGARHGQRGLGPLLLATVAVEPVMEESGTELPVIDTKHGRWMYVINRMAAETEADSDSFLGDGFAQGPDKAVAIGRPYAPARTAIDAGGRVEHVSEYGSVDESGAVCFPFMRHCRRAETVIKIAGEVMLQHVYAGRARVIMNIACTWKSRILTTEGFCFYRKLESVDSKACLGFNTQHALLFTSRELKGGAKDIAESGGRVFDGV